MIRLIKSPVMWFEYRTSPNGAYLEYRSDSSPNTWLYSSYKTLTDVIDKFSVLGYSIEHILDTSESVKSTHTEPIKTRCDCPWMEVYKSGCQKHR